MQTKGLPKPVTDCVRSASDVSCLDGNGSHARSIRARRAPTRGLAADRRNILRPATACPKAGGGFVMAFAPSRRRACLCTEAPREPRPSAPPSPRQEDALGPQSTVVLPTADRLHCIGSRAAQWDSRCGHPRSAPPRWSTRRPPARPRASRTSSILARRVACAIAVGRPLHSSLRAARRGGT